jgi:hypothetical protein
MLTTTALTEVDRAKKFSKLTKTLLAAMFNRETLQKSSLSGKKNNGEQIDPTKVQMIIGMLLIKCLLRWLHTLFIIGGLVPNLEFSRESVKYMQK